MAAATVLDAAPQQHRVPGDGASSTALTLAPQPSSVGAARHAVDALGDGDAVVALLVSEVVTNALVHGAGPIRLTAMRGDRLLRVTVQDDGAGQPYVRRPAETDEGGRGLAMLDLLSLRWGVERSARGKTVWFVVSLDA